MATYKLNIIDRLCIISVLPKQSNYEQMLLVRRVKDKVQLGDNEEAKGVIFKPNGDVFASKEAMQSIMEATFTKAEENIIKESLELTGSEKRLNEAMLNIYEIFVLGGSLEKNDTAE